MPQIKRPEVLPPLVKATARSDPKDIITPKKVTTLGSMLKGIFRNQNSAKSDSTQMASVEQLHEAILTRSSTESIYYSPPGMENYQVPRYTLDTVEDIKNISEVKIIQMVGSGGFGKVYQVERRSDKKIYALKALRKDLMIKHGQVNNVINEKNILKLSSASPFLVHLSSTFQDSVHLYMLQEFLPGGTLLSYIKENGNLSDDHARFYAAEIYLGIKFLHSQRIVYRDLKPDNIIFDAEGHIKIADFGFAKRIAEEKTSTFCGTPSYLAPEIIQKKPYSYEVDWWAFGVIVFVLCSGCSPFQESVTTNTFSRILNSAIRWPPEPHLFFTNDSFDLIVWLLEQEPEDRPYADEICKHDWFASLDFEAIEHHLVRPPNRVKAHTRKNSIILDPNVPFEYKQTLAIHKLSEINAGIELELSREALEGDEDMSESFENLFANF